MKKKSRFRKVAPWAGFALLALVLALLPSLARSAEGGQKATVLTAAATMGEVENTLGGGGTLTAEDPVEVEIPASVDIQEFLVENGEHVVKGQPLAKVDRVTLLGALSETQKSIDILTEKMQVAMSESGFFWLESKAYGRVKAIYAKPGDDAAQTVLEHGALAVVSMDGRMVTRVSPGQPVKAGTPLTVRLSDGTEVPGMVEYELDGVISVIISDNGPKLGDAVTVLDRDGKTVGSGLLEVHSPWNVVATKGSIAAVEIWENQMLSSGTRMICLNQEAGNEAYRSLVDQRRQYEDMMADLFALYEDDTIKSPETGFIIGVDKSIIKNTAVSGTKPVLKLLANEQNPVQTVLILGKPVNDVARGIIVDNRSEEELQYLVQCLYTGTIPLMFLDKLTVIPLMPNYVEKYEPANYKEKMNTCDLVEFDKGHKTVTYVRTLKIDLPDDSYVVSMPEQKEELFSQKEANVLSVIPDNSMTVTMEVDELDIAYYEPGQKADILVDALPGRSFTAEVEEVAAVGKNTGGNSKFTVKLRLDRAPDMLNGMNASVVVHRGVKSGLLLPVAAVYDRGSESFVHVAVDNKTGKPVGELPVVTGVSDGEMVEIVSGLTEGQTVFYEYYLPVTEGES